ncbi:MAG: MFS transporter [Bacteroidia bacterium]|nr:MAG: MFS transporter [Bacteroidia bacterium]
MRFSFITRNILFLSIISFFTDVASEMLYPVIPLYLSTIGISVTGIGFIEGVAETLSALSKTYFGIWSDKLQQRKLFIILGYGLSGLSKPLMIVFPNYLWTLLMRMLDRLGKGIRTAPRDALLSDESSAQNKGKVFGFHRSMDTLGAAIGPLLTLFFLLVYRFSYQSIFLVSFIPGILAVLFSFLINEKKEQLIISQNKKFVQLKELFSYWSRSNSDYKWITAILILFYVFNSSDMLLLLKARSNGIDDYRVIILYIVYNISYALLAFPFGMIGDKLGLKNTIASGLFFFGVVYCGIAFFDSWNALIVLFILYGVYSAAIEGNIKALLSNVVDKKDTASAIGLFTTFQSFTFLISNSLAGWIWDTFNSSLPFIMSGIVAIIVSIVLFFKKLSFNQHNLL